MDIDELIKEDSRCEYISNKTREEFNKFEATVVNKQGKISMTLPYITMLKDFDVLGYHIIASYLYSNIGLVLSKPGVTINIPDSMIYPPSNYFRSKIFDLTPQIRRFLENISEGYQLMNFNQNCYEKIMTNSQILNMLYNFNGIKYIEIDANEIPTYISRSSYPGPFYFKLKEPTFFSSFKAIGRICPNEESEVYKNLDKFSSEQVKKFMAAASYTMIPSWAIIKKNHSYGLAFRNSLNDYFFISSEKVTDGYEWETQAIVFESEQRFYSQRDIPKLEKPKPNQDVLETYIKSLKFVDIKSPKSAKDLSKTILENEYSFSVYFNFNQTDKVSLAAAQMLLLSLSIASISLKNGNELIAVGSAATALFCAASVPDPHQFSLMAEMIANQIIKKFDSEPLKLVISAIKGDPISKELLETLSCPYTVKSPKALLRVFEAAVDQMEESVWEELSKVSAMPLKKPKQNKKGKNVKKKKEVARKIKFSDSFRMAAKTIGRSPLFEF